MAGRPDDMPDFADPQHGLPRLSQLWSAEMEEAAVCLALSPKGQLLAVGTVDDAIAVLDVGSGAVAHTLAGHRGGTNGLAFLSGNSLVSVGEDGAARVWNVARAACLHELPVDAEGADRTRGGHSVNHLAAAPGGKAFACAAGRLVTIFTLGASAQAAPSKKVLGPMESTVESLRFDRHGNLLATYNGGVSYWRFDRTEEEKRELALPYAGACLCGDVTPGVDYIVAGCHDATVHIYHFKQQRQSGVELQEMTCGGYDSKVTAVDFNPRGDRMASSGGDKNTVWNFSGSPTGTMPTLAVGHYGAITCQAWQPDADGWLATGGKDGRLFIYDVDNGVPIGKDMPFVCQPGAVGAADDDDEMTALIFARQGLLYSGHISGMVRKWELPSAGSSDEDEEEDAPEAVALQQQRRLPGQQQPAAPAAAGGHS
ncbi:hypothetical protein ABPG75_012710 [Micractinium tetrahymenae]